MSWEDPIVWFVFAPLAVAFVLAIGRGVQQLNGYVIRLIAESIVAHIGDTLEARWNKSIERAIEPVLNEVQYNEGSSMKDAVRRIERQLQEFIQKGG